MSVLGVVSMPEQTIGPALTKRLREVKPDGWYPIALMIELMETLERKVGGNALRRLGRKLFEVSHAEHVKQIAKSAADILYSFDKLYRTANRGQDIGAWKVVSFGRGTARLEKTTPHHCMMEEGIMLEALATVGVPASVHQERCVRQGADSCLFVATSIVMDERWGSARGG